jgi:hypothetical protein
MVALPGRIRDGDLLKKRKDLRWDYRRAAVEIIHDAVREMFLTSAVAAHRGLVSPAITQAGHMTLSQPTLCGVERAYPAQIRRV